MLSSLLMRSKMDVNQGGLTMKKDKSKKPDDTEAVVDNGREILGVLEVLLASDESIAAVVARAQRHAEASKEARIINRRAARYIIRHYSTLCAASGGASGLPGLIPFVGPVFAVFGAGATDAIIALKFEIEMSMALSSLVGFDISDPRERKLAMLLASAALGDAFDSEEQPNIRYVLELAITEYSTRQLSKAMIKLISQAIFSIAGKRWLKVFPFVGMAISASVNKLLTTHTGWQCYEALLERKRTE